MSDFLSNLAARSLGTAEVVKPRVPSLFEPPRREGGLRPFAPAWRANDAEAGADRGDAEREPAVARIRRSEIPATSNFPVDALPVSAVDPAPRISPELPMQDANPVHQHAVAASARPARAPAVAGFGLPVPLRILRPEIVPEPSSALAATEPQSVRRMARAAQPGVRTFDRPAAFAESRQSGGDASTAEQRTVLPFSSKTAEPDRTSAQIEITREMTRPASPPMIQPAAGVARQRMSQPQADPSIHVTIGRVEVRAIFPEAPTARVPAPRARPTVSLDEYLKRTR